MVRAAKKIQAASAIATPIHTVVIGAGVIGLAVARELALQQPGDDEILVVDSGSYIGSGSSSRNSEVIHGGLYYPTDSLKAKMCVRGRHLIYQYCQERSIRADPIGKFVVATTQEQFDKILPDVLKQSHANGVTDTKLVSADDVQAMGEPNVQCYGALWSPSTGILDSHNFMLHLLGDAEEHGATLALHTNVVDAGIDIHGNNRILLNCKTTTTSTTTNPDEAEDPMGEDDDETMWLSCKRVINCAGLWADRVANMIHNSSSDIHRNDDATDGKQAIVGITTDAAGAGTAAWMSPRQYFAKGNYFRLQGIPSPFTHLIYPVPDPRGGLGIHATLDINGQTKFGPDVEWFDPGLSADNIDYTVDPKRGKSFYDSIRQYWPDLPDGDDVLVPDYSGVRPKLAHPSLLLPQSNNGSNGGKVPFEDFRIVGPRIHGIPGLVHLLGIESPGLTSSMAIAEYVASELQHSN